MEHGKENFFRFSSLLIDLVGEVLRDKLETMTTHSYGSLSAALNDPPIKKKLDDFHKPPTRFEKKLLNDSQHALLYPTGNIELCKYDITLITLLFRNILAVPFVTNPAASDTSFGADLTRLTKMRNSLYAHVGELQMTDVEYVNNCNELEVVLKRLNVTDEVINGYKTTSLLPQREQELRQKLESLQQNDHQMIAHLEDINENIRKLREEVFEERTRKKWYRCDADDWPRDPQYPVFTKVMRGQQVDDIMWMRELPKKTPLWLMTIPGIKGDLPGLKDNLRAGIMFVSTEGSTDGLSMTLMDFLENNPEESIMLHTDNLHAPNYCDINLDTGISQLPTKYDVCGKIVHISSNLAVLTDDITKSIQQSNENDRQREKKMFITQLKDHHLKHLNKEPFSIPIEGLGIVLADDIKHAIPTLIRTKIWCFIHCDEKLNPIHHLNDFYDVICQKVSDGVKPQKIALQLETQTILAVLTSLENNSLSSLLNRLHGELSLEYKEKADICKSDTSAESIDKLIGYIQEKKEIYINNFLRKLVNNKETFALACHIDYVIQYCCSIDQVEKQKPGNVETVDMTISSRLTREPLQTILGKIKDFFVRVFGLNNPGEVQEGCIEIHIEDLNGWNLYNLLRDVKMGITASRYRTWLKENNEDVPKQGELKIKIRQGETVLAEYDESKEGTADQHVDTQMPVEESATDGEETPALIREIDDSILEEMISTNILPKHIITLEWQNILRVLSQLERRVLLDILEKLGKESVVNTDEIKQLKENPDSVTIPEAVDDLLGLIQEKSNVAILNFVKILQDHSDTSLLGQHIHELMTKHGIGAEPQGAIGGITEQEKVTETSKIRAKESSSERTDEMAEVMAQGSSSKMSWESPPDIKEKLMTSGTTEKSGKLIEGSYSGDKPHGTADQQVDVQKSDKESATDGEETPALIKDIDESILQQNTIILPNHIIMLERQNILRVLSHLDRRVLLDILEKQGKQSILNTDEIKQLKENLNSVSIPEAVDDLLGLIQEKSNVAILNFIEILQNHPDTSLLGQHIRELMTKYGIGLVPEPVVEPEPFPVKPLPMGHSVGKKTKGMSQIIAKVRTSKMTLEYVPDEKAEVISKGSSFKMLSESLPDKMAEVISKGSSSEMLSESIPDIKEDLMDYGSSSKITLKKSYILTKGSYFDEKPQVYQEVESSYLMPWVESSDEMEILMGSGSSFKKTREMSAKLTKGSYSGEKPPGFKSGYDYKKVLNHHAQKKLPKMPEYKHVVDENSDKWTASVKIGDRLYKSLSYHNTSKEAHQEAAYQALKQMGYYNQGESDSGLVSGVGSSQNTSAVHPAVPPTASTSGVSVYDASASSNRNKRASSSGEISYKMGKLKASGSSSKMTTKMLAKLTKGSYSGEKPPGPYTGLYTDIQFTEYKRVKDVRVDVSSWRRKLLLINEELWLTGRYGIHVYTTECEKIREIRPQIDGIHGLTYTPQGHVIVASDTGLHQITTTGEYITRIEEGWYRDVCVYKSLLYTLLRGSDKILVHNCNGSEWVKSGEIQIQGDRVGFGDTLYVENNCIYLCHYEDCVIKVFDMSGKLMSTIGSEGKGIAGGPEGKGIAGGSEGKGIAGGSEGKGIAGGSEGKGIAGGSVGKGKALGQKVLSSDLTFNYPHICSVDKGGNILVADEGNHRLLVCNTNHYWQIIDLPDVSPHHALVGEQAESIWVVSRDKKLMKYQKV